MTTQTTSYQRTESGISCTYQAVLVPETETEVEIWAKFSFSEVDGSGKQGPSVFVKNNEVLQ